MSALLPGLGDGTALAAGPALPPRGVPMAPWSLGSSQEVVLEMPVLLTCCFPPGPVMVLAGRQELPCQWQCTNHGDLTTDPNDKDQPTSAAFSFTHWTKGIFQTICSERSTHEDKDSNLQFYRKKQNKISTPGRFSRLGTPISR